MAPKKKKEENEAFNLRARDFELNMPLAPQIPPDLVDIKLFRNLQGVKAANQTKAIPREQALHYLSELKKCKEDPVYFAENYFYIISYKGKQIIRLYPKQKQMLRSFISNSYSINLASRQSGKCLFRATIRVREKSGKEYDTTLEKLYKQALNSK